MNELDSSRKLTLGKFLFALGLTDYLERLSETLPVTTNQNIDEIEGMVLRSDILREAAADKVY